MALQVRPKIFDVLIIGSGPAGLNAALICARGRRTALVFDLQTYRNEGVKHMHSVASRDHFNPREFGAIARFQIESHYDSVWFQHPLITHASKQPIGPSSYDGFEVKDSNGGIYQGKKLILATGSQDILPDIPGYKENWPDHIYQCLGCDGYEQRGTPIGILSFDSAAYGHMVQAAHAFSPPSITIFSNGPLSTEPSVQKAWKLAKTYGATLDERNIVRMLNNGPTHEEGITLEFETGGPVTLGFVVHKPATVNRAQRLIDQLGVQTVEEIAGGHVKIASPLCNETSVRGVFAAGDTMVLMKQVAIAMAEGLKAGVGAAMQLGQEEAESRLKEAEAREVKGQMERETEKVEAGSYA